MPHESKIIISAIIDGNLSSIIIPITEALHLVSTAAKHANDAMKRIEKFKKLLEVQESLGGTVDLVSPTRELLKEGKIVKISARSGDHQDRYLFLVHRFDSCLFTFFKNNCHETFLNIVLRFFKGHLITQMHILKSYIKHSTLI